MPFYAPPPGLALDDLAERVAARVVDMYSAVEAELLAIVARRLHRDLPVADDLYAQIAVIRDLQDAARALLGRIPPDLADQIVRLAMEAGTAAAADALPLADGMSRASTITPASVSTLTMVAADLGNAFDQVALRILRYPIDAVGNFIGTDAYQQTIARHVGTVTVGRLPTVEARARALSDFLDQGITGFTDRIGRQWRIGSYTEMATRSATARAYVEAKNYRMRSNGIGLVSILGNNDACRLCAPWFGKVLSIDGTPAGVHEMQHATTDGVLVTVEVAATLDDARRAGLMHPNCACTTAPYFPGLSVPVSATHFDAEAAAGRDRQRELERRVRDLKRQRDVADALGDSGRAASLSGRVRATQAQIRDLLEQTGQHRRYDREQTAWADGPSRRPAQPPVVPVVVPKPPTSLRRRPSRARVLLREGPDGS